MIPDVQSRPWSDLVVAYLVDPDALQTAVVHLHPQGRASATLHPWNGGPARDLEDPAAPGRPLLAPLPTVLAVLALVLPALRGEERRVLGAIRAHPACPPDHAACAHRRLREAASPDAPSFLRLQD
jgi:hypothetical protein